MRVVLLIAGLGVLLGASPSAGADVPSAAASSLPAAKDGLRPAAKGLARGKRKACCGYPLVGEGEWALRFYWVTRQKSYDLDFDEEDIYTRDGMYIGSFPEGFVRALKMEGTGRLDDGRLLNTAGRCAFGVGTCFETLDERVHPHGRGAGRRALVPFTSVAVDRNLVPIGEPLYIPEFDGLPLPDGHVHDGCVRADDTGGNIKKRKLDFFVESWSNWRFLLQTLNGQLWITPQIENPRCEYLRQNPT